MAVGTLVLVGWILHITVLESVVPGLVAMRPNTAVCFILLGIGLWLSSQLGNINLKRKIAAQACAFFTAAVGAVTLSERLLGFNTGINDLLFRKELLALNTPFPGRMAHISGLEFVILRTALALLNAKSRCGQRLAQNFALVGTVIGLVILVGYVYGAEALYRISVFSSVALNSALLFTVLGFAILCARPDQGLMSTVTSTNLGGLLARRIIPVALTLPFLIGWLRLQGQHAGLYGTEFGLAIFTIANVLIFATLVWLGSRSLNKADAERLRTAVELQATNELLREKTSVLDLAQVLVRDMESRIVEWNLGAERIYGFSKEEALGRISHELLNTQFPEPPAQIEDTLRRRGKWEGELVHRKRDGGRLIVSSQWVLHRDSAGYPIRILETNTDITDRKQAEEELKVLNETLEMRVRERTAQAEAANRMKSAFLANMSHELRTPLNGIIGFAEFLVDGKPGPINPKQKEYLQDILNSGQHLLQLINDVLDLAKVEAGKMELNPENFSLGKAIEEVCAATKPIVQKKGIRLEANVAPELGYVTLDQQKFKQVLYNLLSNAVKFTDDGSKVEIGVAMYDGYRFKLSVQDTGIGIKAEDLSRLFKEFEQLGSGAARRYEGTGLGLALTRRIVELHGGTIGVESEVGKGSTFTVVLPLVWRN
jgi:PAS domain S-box-containing protein